MSKLKIYACTGVGTTQEPGTRYNYWTDNTNTVYNTQAVNTMLLFINSAIIDINYLNLPDEAVRERLNHIDLCACSLYFANLYKDNIEELENAGRAIGRLYAMGLFSFDSLDNALRDRHLDQLFEAIEKELDNDVAGDEEFAAWWNKYILSRNKRGFTDAEARNIDNTLKQYPISGIGSVDWQSEPELSKYFNDSGTYFLYTYFSDDQLKKLPYLFTRKAKAQRQIYNTCKEFFTQLNGSEEEMKIIIRDGIIKDFGKTPEELVDGITSDYIGITGEKKIGIVWTASAIAALVVGILSAVATLVVGVVKAVLAAKAKKEAQEIKSSYTDAYLSYNVPDTNDYGWFGISTIFSSASLWIVGALAAGLLFFGMRD